MWCALITTQVASSSVTAACRQLDVAMTCSAIYNYSVTHSFNGLFQAHNVIFRMLQQHFTGQIRLWANYDPRGLSMLPTYFSHSQSVVPEILVIKDYLLINTDRIMCSIRPRIFAAILSKDVQLERARMFHVSYGPWHTLQKLVPEIGATGLNSLPDSGASFSCWCTTSNVIDCLRAPEAVNDVRSRASARKTGTGIWHRIYGTGFWRMIKLAHPCSSELWHSISCLSLL